MNGQRALEVLGSFAAGPLAFTAEEIEELIALGLVMEADPDDFATLRWIDPAVREFGECPVDDPSAPEKLAAKLAELDEKLKSDWFRFTTSDEKLALREQERRTLRRSLAYLNDKPAFARVTFLAQEARAHLPAGGSKFMACAALGDELYALTAKGGRVQYALALRAERYKDYPLAAFMKAFEKADQKMLAFGADIATLSNNVGYVRKNPHQVVIGLAKTGMPAQQALDTYLQARHTSNTPPDVAVTLARNATTLGGTQQAAHKLRAAQVALEKAGFPATPVVHGAAKTLLPYEPLGSGVVRFTEIALLLDRDTFARGDAKIKHTARLMPAEGTPADVVRRTVLVYRALGREGHEELATAVALASMVKTDDAIAPLVQRFRQVQNELVRLNVSQPHVVTADALECVACPGTPTEVAATVQALVARIAQQAGREPYRSDVAIAVAFAKRFAY